MIFETFRQAIQNVWSNKLRTFLTMLGIIIGVMAVIVIVGLGNGMTKSMRDSFSALGTNTLSIQVWGYGSRTVPVDDMYDICQRHSDLIKAVSPQIEFSGNASGTLKIGTTSYRWSNISGVDENYTEMKNYQLAQGRGLQYMDMQDNKQVCIIGDYLNRVAFGGNGVGQTLKIGANKFRIVGVLAAKALTMDFVDTDLLLQRKAGRPLQRMVDELGAEGFAHVEEACVCGLEARGAVIATGGSVAMEDAAMEHLKEGGLVIFLRLPLETLSRRLKNMKTRGIAMEKGQTLRDLYERRQPAYLKWADAVVDAEGLGVEETVARVVAAVREREGQTQETEAEKTGKQN